MAQTAQVITTEFNGFLNQEIDRIFSLQQTQAVRLRESSTLERIAKLNALREGIKQRLPDLYEAAQTDLGKPEAETYLNEIYPSLQEAKETIGHLKGWMKPKRVMPSLTVLGTQGWVKHEPRGICLIISPWNYPINLTFGPLISAIAAGNTAIIKPSELTPNLSRVIRQIIESCFEAQDVAVFEGEVEVAQALLAKPFDHIFFTGSPAVGKHVMRAASEHLTSVTLELGGKSPVIIDETANLKKAAKNLVWAKFTNNGQTCIAPDYLLVHESVYDDFVGQLWNRICEVYGQTSQQRMANPDYCRIVSDPHHERLSNMIGDARKNGAQVLGGEVDADESFIDPTLVLKPTDHSRIMQEEIFGPLLPIVTYRNLDKAIDTINAKPKPLALYIFSNQQKNIDSILARTSSGSTVINHAVIQFMHGNLPFGGVGNSGIGNAHGFYGFRAFSHERAVVRERFSFLHMIFPPYTASVLRIIQLLKRFL